MSYPKTFAFWSSAEGLLLAAHWARAGLDSPSVARRMNIHVQTLQKWRRKSPKLDTALLQSDEMDVARIEDALIRRACGFTVSERCDEDAPNGLKSKTAEKFVPPDLSAQLFYLKARSPERWGEEEKKRDDGVVREIIEAVRQVE